MTNKEIMYLMCVCKVIHDSSLYNTLYKTTNGKYILDKNNLPLFLLDHVRDVDGSVLVYLMMTIKVRPAFFKKFYMIPHSEIWSRRMRRYFSIINKQEFEEEYL